MAFVRASHLLLWLSRPNSHRRRGQEVSCWLLKPRLHSWLSSSFEVSPVIDQSVSQALGMWKNRHIGDCVFLAVSTGVSPKGSGSEGMLIPPEGRSPDLWKAGSCFRVVSWASNRASPHQLHGSRTHPWRPGFSVHPVKALGAGYSAFASPQSVKGLCLYLDGLWEVDFKCALRFQFALKVVQPGARLCWHPAVSGRLSWNC